MTTTQAINPALDWHAIATQRMADLTSFAASNGVHFSEQETATLVALTLRLDAERALAEMRALTMTRPERPTIEPGSISAVGVAEVLRPDGPYLVLRRGAEAWIVPDMPDGWNSREPWSGEINSVNWIGGPPARAAFRRVGAPVNG